MIDGRFDPAFAQVFGQDLVAQESPASGLSLRLALIGYGTVLAALFCLWLMAPMP
ncbi:hypothetical protein [Neogemmobacter tilapiae]|jgi:hypothetical protein|uniref:Uncharacterized protein n=1 Tax=Neogemmobacter tilapiae TaxID=875041 RepID=A0A918TK12_9RHOB|nr:hypothetical protein [Gemmobacter tilapiae]GHC51256.1 hypothetical protein GCM10007315_12020 [Gemmobacter tilapiae]